MQCICCKLEVEVRDGIELCHYCYLRECQANPGKCANALTDWEGLKEAIAAVKLAELSLHWEKAPRYSKETIEAEREKASNGLLIALDLLTKQLEGAGK